MQEQQVRIADLLARVLVYVLAVVLVGVVEAVLGVIVEAHGLVAVEGYLCKFGLVTALGGGVLREAEAVVKLAVLMLELEALLVDGLHELRAVGEEAVLKPVVDAVGVAGEGRGGIGLAHAVDVIPAGGAQEAVRGLAAAGVDDYRVVAEGNLSIVGAYRAHRAYALDIGDVRKEREHTGDAALGGYLIEYFRVGDAALRQAGRQVVYHDAEGAEHAYVLLDGLAGQRVREGRGRGRRARLRRGGGAGAGRVLGVRRGQGRGILTAGGEGEQHGRAEHGGEQFFHMTPRRNVLFL